MSVNASLLDFYDIRLVIFDVDNVLRFCTVAGQPCPNSPDQWEPNIAAFKWLRANKWDERYIALASNQGGVSLGYLTLQQAFAIMEPLGFLVAHATNCKNDILPIMVCPHYPRNGKNVCACRKPAPLMLRASMQRFRVRPENTLYVDDMDSGKLCADNAGCWFAPSEALFDGQLEGLQRKSAMLC